jgi:hypothetical protein
MTYSILPAEGDGLQGIAAIESFIRYGPDISTKKSNNIIIHWSVKQNILVRRLGTRRKW